jgi:hypothetical protein
MRTVFLGLLLYKGKGSEELERGGLNNELRGSVSMIMATIG